jgi:hypothetical protein
MVSEWIYNAPEKPSMRFRNWRYFGGSCGNSLGAHRRGVFRNQQHPNRAPA